MSIVVVAEKAGVSYATVSRVINGRAGVSEETRLKVKKALKETGYQIPPKGRRRGPSTSQHRGIQYGTLILLWTCSRAEAMSPVASALLHGANAAAVKEGLTLIVDCVAETGLLPHAIESEKVDGVLVVGPEPDPSLVEKLKRFPCIWLLSRGPWSWMDRVQPDNEAIGRLAFEALVHRGHKRLACTYVKTRTGTPAYTQRADAFLSIARANGIPVDLICHELDDGAVDSHHKDFPIDQALKNMIEQYLAVPNRPTGLFVTDDMMVSLHHELIAHGIKPGSDMEIVCCNRENLRSVGVKPSPLVISIQPELIGQLAVNRILWRADNSNHPSGVRVLISPELLNPDEPSEFFNAHKDALTGAL